jgi:hypothetical protein
LLYVNLFADGGALLEANPQGDASYPVNLRPEDAAVLAGLLSSLEASAALARLFLAGATAGKCRPGSPRRRLRLAFLPAPSGLSRDPNRYEVRGHEPFRAQPIAPDHPGLLRSLP